VQPDEVYQLTLLNSILKNMNEKKDPVGFVGQNAPRPSQIGQDRPTFAS